MVSSGQQPPHGPHTGIFCLLFICLFVVWLFVCLSFSCLNVYVVFSSSTTGESLWPSARDHPWRGRLHLRSQPPPDGQGEEDQGEQKEKGGFKKTYLDVTSWYLPLSVSQCLMEKWKTKKNNSNVDPQQDEIMRLAMELKEKKQKQQRQWKI